MNILKMSLILSIVIHINHYINVKDRKMLNT